jgi:hypothetical protein
MPVSHWLRCAMLVAAAGAPVAAQEGGPAAHDSGFVAELAITLGACAHQRNALEAHHAQADVSLSVAVVRERDRAAGGPSHVIGGIVGYRSSTDFPLSGEDQTEEIFLGPALHLCGSARHELRLGFGPDVVTARRSIGGAYATATAIGGWAELDWLCRIEREGKASSAVGLALGVYGADVGFLGGRVPVGGYHLGILLSSDF